jgi:Methyltransferase domain
VVVKQRPRRDYLALLDRIHEALRPRTYVEIGVGFGRSLAAAQPDTRAIVIDPNPQEFIEPIRCSPEFFRVTSDEFFAENDLRALLGGPYDLAFIDGQHLIEFALRDFINLERVAGERSVILLHDCIPIDEQSSTRTRTTIDWTGDVWKLVPCLREHRPDLRITVIDVPLSGMAIVTGLDSDSTLLHDNYDDICERYVGMGYDAINGATEEKLTPIPNDWERIVGLLPGSRL